jgi:CBS domain containing-hemolysin-like protein
LDESGILEIVLNLILVLFLVVLNGFFVAAEFSLVKVRATRLSQLASEGNVRAKVTEKVVGRLDAYLSATQLGITLASLGLGWLGEPAIANLIVEPLLSGMSVPNYIVSTLSFAIAFAIITFLHIVVGELAPKSLAIQKSEATAMWIAAPLIVFYKIAYPAIWFLNGAANRMLKWFGIEPVTDHEAAHTEEEIRLLVGQSHKSGHIDQTEMKLMDNVFTFSDRLVREIMVPRTSMECLYENRPFSENMDVIRETRHTRYPVAREEKDHIIGFIHVMDILANLTDQKKTENLDNWIRPILTVPESMEVSHVLVAMQKKRVQMAIIIDEYGGTAGMVTLEDIVEEIVGDIQDEFDNERPEIETKGDYLSVDGRTLIEEINDQLNLEIDDSEVDTIGGWIYSQLDEPPQVGMKVTHDDLDFEINEVDHLRIIRLNIHKVKKKEGKPSVASKSELPEGA